MLVHPGPDFSVEDVYAGYVAGFKKLGVQVARYNLGDRLKFYQSAYFPTEEGFKRAFPDDRTAAALAAHGMLGACYEVQPDVVVIVSGFFVTDGTMHTMRERGQKVVLVCTESPYEDDQQLRRAPYADVVLLNDPANIDKFRRVNKNTYYMPHAYNPTVHFPADPEPDLVSQFCFVGTGFQSRVEFFEQVDWTGLDVCLAGNWPRKFLSEGSPIEPFIDQNPDECIDNADAVRLYRAAKASANLYRKEAERPELEDGWAMGPREVELAATGTFFLREPRGEGDEVLGMLPTFKDPGDFGEQLRWWLAHDDKREAAAAKARKAVADRTFEANARRLLSLIGK